MNRKELNSISEKYAKNSATREERLLLERFFSQVQDANSDTLVPTSNDQRDRIYNQINKRTQPEKSGANLLFRYIAAASIILAILSTGYISQEVFTSNHIVHRTNKGERKIITLQDGSIVTLSSETTIRFPEEFKNTRDVELQGEAFFKVARNPERPFIVRTENFNTRVLGTSFNIRALEDSKGFVSVNTGRVEVRHAKNQSAKVVLTEGEQVFYSENSFQLMRGNSQDYSAWTKNVIVLKNKTLGEAAITLENWFDVKISFENSNLKKMRIEGKYRDESLANILKSIALLKAVKIDTLTQKHFIIREEKKQN